MEIRKIDFENLDFTHFLVSKTDKTIIGMAKEKFTTKLYTFLVSAGFAKTREEGEWFDLSFEDARKLKKVIQRCLYFNAVHVYKTEKAFV